MNMRKKYLWCIFTVMIFMVSDIVSGQSPFAAWKFEEASGTIEDVLGNYDGSYTGNLYQQSGKTGCALGFDGLDDSVSISTINLGTINTITAWIYSNDLSSYESVLGYTGDSYMSPLMLRNISGETYFYYHDGAAYKTINLGEDISGSWKHIAVVRNDTVVNVYLDFIWKGSFNLINNTDICIDVIGARSNGVVLFNYFNGAIDELRLYEQALSQEELPDVLCTVGHWRMDEGCGTASADISGNDNDALFVNMTESAWETGHINPDGCFRKALAFDGSDDYLNCGNDSSFNFNSTNAFTISCWIKPENLSSYQGIIGKWGGGWASSPYQIIVHSNGSIMIGIGNGVSYSTIYLPANCFHTGKWHHIAATYDGSTLRGYVNGIEEASSVAGYSLTSNVANLIIGRYANYAFSGTIDDVRLYSRALNEDEIAAMQYNLLSVYPDHNYYTSETPVAVCNINMPDTELEECYLEAVDALENTLGTNTTPENGADLAYNISSLSNGNNTITVRLCLDSGVLVFEREMEIIKRAPSSGVEVKVDQRDSKVLIDGAASFPVGIYMSGITSASTSDFQAVANANFNTIIRWNTGVAPSDATTYLQNADTYGLTVIDWQTAYTLDNLNNYKLSSAVTFWNEYVAERDRIIDAVGYAKLEDNLLGYYTFDEPLEAQLSAGQDLYGRTNNEDGYHPTFALYSSSIPVGDAFTNWCDVLGVDTYWYPPRIDDSIRDSVDWVTKYVSAARERAKQDHKALWIVLQTEYWSGSYKRAILPAEQRCQTYLALIHGAKGIFYWRYPIYHESSWSILSELAHELNILGSIMMTEDLKQSISYSSGIFNPENNQFSDVQVCLRKAPAGASYDYVLLATNTKRYPVDVDFTISLLGSSCTVSRIFDTSTYTVSNGCFSDQIEGFGTRAYTFSSSSTEAIAINVDMTPRTDLEPGAEDAPEPLSGRAGCTNLMQNPTLESNTLINWADYCFPYCATPLINATNQGWGLVDTPDLTGLQDAIENDGGEPLDEGNPGSTCLKIVKNTSLNNGFHFRLAPVHNDPSGKDYTFSIYLKADQNGYSVRLGSTSSSQAYVTVNPTTSWERRSFTINIPKDVSSQHRFYVLLESTGTIWVDAVQVEESSSASPFTTE